MADNTKNNGTGEKTPAAKVGRARNTGDIDALKAMHWLAVRTAYRNMKAARTLDEQLSCIHALNQASGSYSRLLEKSDLKTRIEQVEAKLKEVSQSRGLRKAI